MKPYLVPMFGLPYSLKTDYFSLFVARQECIQNPDILGGYILWAKPSKYRSLTTKHVDKRFKCLRYFSSPSYLRVETKCYTGESVMVNGLQTSFINRNCNPEYSNPSCYSMQPFRLINPTDGYVSFKSYMCLKSILIPFDSSNTSNKYYVSIPLNKKLLDALYIPHTYYYEHGCSVFNVTLTINTESLTKFLDNHDHDFNKFLEVFDNKIKETNMDKMSLALSVDYIPYSSCFLENIIK